MVTEEHQAMVLELVNSNRCLIRLLTLVVRNAMDLVGINTRIRHVENVFAVNAVDQDGIQRKTRLAPR